MDLIVPESDYFENKKEWMRVFEVLQQLVKEYPNEPKYLCKLAFLCWYHTSESDGDLESLNEDLLDSTLMECFIKGREKFSEDVNYLVVFGQMMSLTPYLFEDENLDYFDIRKIASDYIEKACILEPDNIFIKLLFLDTREVTEKSLSEKLFEGFKKLLNIETVQEKEYNKLNNKVAHDISNFGFSGLMLEFCKDMNLPK